VVINSNLTADRATFVTHLECSMTGERYEADQLHGLSRVGRPLLVRYDLEAVKAALPKASLEARQTDLWRWRELLPVRHTGNIVSLGEIETPLVAIPKSSGSANVLVKDEGRLPTGSFKARGLVMAVAMAKELGVTKIAMPTNGNAGAALAAYATRPRKRPRSISARSPRRAHASTASTGRSTIAARSSGGAPPKAAGSTSRP
jgi:threonine synthase